MNQTVIESVCHKKSTNSNIGVKMMMPHVSIAILLVYLTAIAYLLVVGFLGAIYGEPLGFILLALGITVSIPFINGYKYA